MLLINDSLSTIMKATNDRWTCERVILFQTNWYETGEKVRPIKELLTKQDKKLQKGLMQKAENGKGQLESLK